MMVIFILLALFIASVVLITCIKIDSSKSGKSKEAHSHSIPRSPAKLSSETPAKSLSTNTAPSASPAPKSSHMMNKSKQDSLKFHIASSHHTLSENKTNLESVENDLDNPLLDKRVQEKLRNSRTPTSTTPNATGGTGANVDATQTKDSKEAVNEKTGPGDAMTAQSRTQLGAPSKTQLGAQSETCVPAASVTRVKPKSITIRGGDGGYGASKYVA